MANRRHATVRPPRSMEKLRAMLQPQSVAVMGVSEKLNPGHVILNNLLREQFPRERVYVVKPNSTTLEGCRCVPDVASLPERVDLLVLSVDAAQVPGIVADVAKYERAQGIIAIPGGLGEKAGSEALAQAIEITLTQSRSTAWGGPVLNGPNCLGIRSRPGRYDTLFIPAYKLPLPSHPETPLALISQSGAFAITTLSKLEGVSPRYLISMGNQLDLTVGDYLTCLAEDTLTKVFACYVEGFVPRDFEPWLTSAHAIIASGRTVVLYLAGRTAAGARAAKSHTNSVPKSRTQILAKARAAGVLVAETLADFEDLCRLAGALKGERPKIKQIAGISNAGFECVAISDSLAGLELATFGTGTREKLAALLAKSRIDAIVGVQNPLDLTPIANDAAFAEAVQICLGDDAVDAAVVGLVPLTGMLTTLLPAPHHPEDLARPEAIAMRLGHLARGTTKPIVVAVDSGTAYDGLASKLQEQGLFVTRTVDQATQTLARFSTR